MKTKPPSGPPGIGAAMRRVTVSLSMRSLPSAAHTSVMTGSNGLSMPHDLTSTDIMLNECTDKALLYGHGRGHTGLIALPTARTVPTPGGLVSLPGRMMIGRICVLPTTIVARRAVPMTLSTLSHC